MNTREAKALTAASMNKHGIPFSRMTAKTVGFSDLMRSDRVIVSVFGMTLPDTRLADLETECSGFSLDYNQKP